MGDPVRLRPHRSRITTQLWSLSDTTQSQAISVVFTQPIHNFSASSKKGARSYRCSWPSRPVLGLVKPAAHQMLHNGQASPVLMAA